MEDQQQDISKMTQNQDKTIDQDIQRIAPLNLDKPKDTKEGVQSTIDPSKIAALKEVCVSIRDYISSYISLADTKAGILIGIYSALISLGIAKGPKIYEVAFKQWGMLEYVSLAFLGSFVFGIVLCLKVVWPKTSTSKKQGFVSWVHISNYEKVDNYLKGFLSATEAQIHTQIAELNYDLSIICKKKYELLSLAFKAGVAGSVLLAAVLLLKY